MICSEVSTDDDHCEIDSPGCMEAHCHSSGDATTLLKLNNCCSF